MDSGTHFTDTFSNYSVSLLREVWRHGQYIYIRSSLLPLDEQLMMVGANGCRMGVRVG